MAGSIGEDVNAKKAEVMVCTREVRVKLEADISQMNKDRLAVK